MNQILLGDCLDHLKTMTENTVDIIATDPPYGYSFMGKDWDKAVPSVEIWKECLRVLKPGAFAFVMSAPRQDVLSQMIVRLSQAGFNTEFTSIYWTYASGFPKAANIGKQVDRKAGRIGVSTKKLKLELRRIFDNCGKTRKQVDEECGFRASNYLRLDKEGKRPDPWTHILPSQDKWQKMKLVLGVVNDEEISDQLDHFFAEAEREVLGTVTKADSTIYTQTIGQVASISTYNITAPATPQAKALDGSYAGFQPKPAVEIIIVAMKPLSEKTYVDQALANGKGITWLDDCRIPYRSEDDKPKDTIAPGWAAQDKKNAEEGFRPNRYTTDDFDWKNNPQGRFPANLLVSDDVLNDGRITKSTGGVTTDTLGKNVYGKFSDMVRAGAGGYGDSGSFSRYFDLDKWAAERLPKEVLTTYPFLIEPKADKSEKNKGLESNNLQKVNDGRQTPIDNPFQRGETPRKNTHPTVKPIELFSYLITLGSRIGDLVLDPFCGSGTACIAARLLRRNYIGIELEKQYHEIAMKRMSAWPATMRLEEFLQT